CGSREWLGPIFRPAFRSLRLVDRPPAAPGGRLGPAGGPVCGGRRGLLRQRRRAQDESVLVLLQPALQVERPARDQHAVAELGADAVEGAVERGAPARLALLEQRALLAPRADEAGERDPQRVERDAAREQPAEQRERE